MSQRGLPQRQEKCFLSHFASLLSLSTLLKRPRSKALWEVARRPAGEDTEGWWGEEFPRSASVEIFWLKPHLFHHSFHHPPPRPSSSSPPSSLGSALTFCRNPGCLDESLLSLSAVKVKQSDVIEMQRQSRVNICAGEAHPERYKTVAFTSGGNTDFFSLLWKPEIFF